jgi:flavin-binding protein dodecin
VRRASVTGSGIGHRFPDPVEQQAKENLMTDHVYRVTEVVGTSSESLEGAIRTGIGKAAETIRGLDWFEVIEIRGHLEEGSIQHFQVTMKVGFRVGA